MPYSSTTVKYNEIQSIRNGAASTVTLNLTNNFFTLFAILVLGATNYQVSLISSLPSIIGMCAMLPAAIYINRLERKKEFTVYTLFFTRIFLLFMVFIPFIKPSLSSWIFVALIGLMNLPGTFVNLGWQALIGDLIPDNRRNKFFGKRNFYLTIIGMVVTLLVGFCMRGVNSKSAFPYQALFFIAFLFSLVELYYLKLHKEKPVKTEKSNYQSPFSKRIFKNKPYAAFLICGLFFNFGWQMAWSLFSIYQIRYAHATAYWISFFTVSNQISQIVSYPWWAKMADKWSNRTLLVWISIGMALAPILNILSINYVYLLFINFFSGFFVSGTVLILFNSLLEVSEEEHRTSYIANYNFLLSIVAFIAPQVGVYLLETFSMNTSMILSTIFRGLSALFFIWMGWYLKTSKRQMKEYDQQVNNM